MADHSKYKEMLVEFVYGEISREREEELLRHISTCSECREDLRQLLQARDLASVLRKKYPSPPVLVEERVAFPWAALAFLLFLLLLFFNLPRNEVNKEKIQAYQPSWEVLELKSPDFSLVLDDFKDYFVTEDEKNKTRR